MHDLSASLCFDNSTAAFVSPHDGTWARPSLLRSLRARPRPRKDTEAAVGDVQMPEVDPQVVRRHVGLVVGVDRDGVDVVGVGVGEHSARAHFHHQVHGLQHWHLGQSSLSEQRGGPNNFKSFVLHHGLIFNTCYS